jgi:hypothetical protein
MPLTRHDAFGYESSLPASRPGYWSGFLGGFKNTAMYIGRGAVIAAVAAASPFIIANNAKAAEPDPNVPLTFRVNSDYSNVSKLADYNAVQQIGLNSMPRGLIVFEDETTIVPPGWRIWFLDDGTKPQNWDESITFLAGLQPMGVVNTNSSGLYSFIAGPAIQGDEPGTYDVDEGATVGKFLTLVGQNLGDNSFYEAGFTSGTMMTNGFQQVINKRHDILIDRNKKYTPCGDWQHLPPVGDLNQDCVVDFADLEILEYYWLVDCTDPNSCGGADLYPDDANTVNFLDYSVLAQHWNECTDPNCE